MIFNPINFINYFNKSNKNELNSVDKNYALVLIFANIILEFLGFLYIFAMLKEHQIHDHYFENISTFFHYIIKFRLNLFH